MRIDDQSGRAAIVDHEGEFGAGETEVQRHENPAEARCREHREEEHRLVQAEEGDAITFGDSQRLKPRSAGLDVALHIGEGPGSVFEK